MARFVLCADLHIRSNKPKHRKDDYFESVVVKLQQIIDLANKRKANILCAGDIFDHTKVGHKVVNKIIDVLNSFNHKFYVVYGQHDSTYHSKNLENSPLYTLLDKKNVILLNSKKPKKINGFYVYGCSWEEKPIKPKTKKSILVIHKSITPKDPPFFLKDALSSKDFLNKHKGYSFIVSGDYHHPFIYSKQNRTIINCGTIMRNKIDMFDFKPRVYFLDTNNDILKPIFLKIKKPKDVFLEVDENKHIDQKFGEELNDLIKELKKHSKRPNFSHIVHNIKNKMKVDQQTNKNIERIMEKAKNG